MFSPGPVHRSGIHSNSAKCSDRWHKTEVQVCMGEVDEITDTDFIVE